MNDAESANKVGTGLPPGTRIGESYVVVRPLGEGGSGQVYLARDEWLDRHVAVKLFHRGSDVAAFEAELDALAELNHPNVISVLDRGIHRDGRNYLVTAFIAGPSLRDVLASEGAFGFAETHRLLRELASGIEALHQRGIVHGDLKPDNVLLRPMHDARFAPVIIDLGFSGQRDSRPERLAASPAYVAPERLVGGAMGAPADIYALALIAFELLTGHSPMTRADLPATVHAHLSPQRPTLPVRSGGVPWPDGLEAALLQGIALDPKRRPRSPTALVEAIHRALEPHLVEIVSARCPSCARANIEAGDYCSDCGVQALPTRCPNCGNSTDPCLSTRCLNCDRSLVVHRSPRRPTKTQSVVRIGTRAVLVALGDALDRVDARFTLESEIRRSGGQLLGTVGAQFVATFERTRDVPTAAQQATRVAFAVHRRVCQALELPTSSFAIAVEAGSEEGSGFGVRRGQLELDQPAAREAVRLAWTARLHGEGGVWVGSHAARLLPPGSSSERIHDGVRVLELGGAALRLPLPTADFIAHAQAHRGADRAAAVILKASSADSRRAAVTEVSRAWCDQHGGGQIVVPGRGHQLRPLGVVKTLMRNALVDWPEVAGRTKRVAEALARSGDSRERARSDAQLLLRALAEVGEEAEFGLVDGALSALMWRAVDGLLPEQLVLSVEEASSLSIEEATQLLRLVEKRGPGSCLVLGCAAALPSSPLHVHFTILDADAILPDGGYAALTAVLPDLKRIPDLRDALPRLTGGRASSVRDVFALITHLATQAIDSSQLADILSQLADRPDTLRAAHLALLSSEEARCLRTIAAIGQDAMYSVVAILLADIDVAGCIEVLAGLGFVDVDYSRYDGGEVSISVRDPGLEAWIREEYAEEARAQRHAARQTCLSGHSQLSIDLGVRFATLVAEDGDSLEAVRLLLTAANQTRHEDPWLALKLLDQAAARLATGGGSSSLLGRSLGMEVALMQVQVSALHAEPEVVLAHCDDLQRQSLDVVEAAQVDRARAIALRRLGWAAEAFPVLERALRVLAEHEHEESLFADICEILAELHFEQGSFEDTRRVVRLYFAATGSGPFVAGPQARISSWREQGGASVYDANTDTFGVAERADEQHVQGANLRMRLLLAQASLHLDQVALGRRELEHVRGQAAKLAGTQIEADVALAAAAFLLHDGNVDAAVESVRHAARDYWRLGRDDEATAAILWILEQVDCGAERRQQFLTCLADLRPERPELRRRRASQVRSVRGAGRWVAITEPGADPMARPARGQTPNLRSKS